MGGIGSGRKADKKHEEIRAYKADGHTNKEVAEHFGISYTWAKKICKGLPAANHGEAGWFKSKDIEDVKAMIRSCNPDIEYVDGYKNMDSMVIVKCLKCGDVFKRSMVSIRHKSRTACPVCGGPGSHLKIYANKTERRRAQEKRKRKRKQQRYLFEHYFERLCKKQERHEQALINAERRKQAAIEKRETRRHNCPVCGTSTTRRKYCSDECARKAANARHETMRRLRITANMVDNDITLEALFRRDNGRCWICGLPCDYSDIETTDKANVAGDLYPSIDHVVALSDGGEHSWENVRLAHRICNSKRYWEPLGGMQKVRNAGRPWGRSLEKYIAQIGAT